MDHTNMRINIILRCYINRLMPRYGHKYTKNKMRLSIMTVICIKQHLSNIWSWTHAKVKQRWGWVKKGVAYKKERVQLLLSFKLKQASFCGSP